MKFDIYNYLKAAPGPVKRLELLQAMRVTLNDQTLKDRKLRKTVEEMITQDGYLIASSEQGYHLIQTEEQLTEAMEYLTNKAASISIRKNCLLRNFRKHFKREPVCQPVLFG
jgi:hypothetical protein